MDNQQPDSQQITSVELPKGEPIQATDVSTVPQLCMVCQNQFPANELAQHLSAIHKLPPNTNSTLTEDNKQSKQENHPNLNAGNNNKENKWAEKWKTPEERRLACERYCEYLRRGRSKMYYPDADENTIKRYMEVYPEEFRADLIADAERKGLSVIEDRLHAASVGKIPGAVPTLLIFIAKNKLKWKDRIDATTDEKPLQGSGLEQYFKQTTTKEE